MGAIASNIDPGAVRMSSILRNELPNVAKLTDASTFENMTKPTKEKNKTSMIIRRSTRAMRTPFNWKWFDCQIMKGAAGKMLREAENEQK